MTSRRTSRATLLAAVAAAATSILVLGGCTPSGLPPASTPPPPTPTSSEYLDALEHTRSLGTATAVIELGAPVGDVATGAVAFYDGHGDLLWEASDGSVRRERSNGRGVFVQDAPPDGPWRRPAATPASVALADPLRGLGQVTVPRRLGPELLEGEPTVRYTGTIPASPEQLEQLGLSPEARTAAGPAGLEVRITTWIDGSGRMVRIDRELMTSEADEPAVSARVSTRLSDFSRVIDLSTPPGVED